MSKLAEEIVGLLHTADASRTELRRRFLLTFTDYPAAAMERVAMELVEVDHYFRLLEKLNQNLQEDKNRGAEEVTVRAQMEYTLGQILKGEWQPGYVSSMCNAMNQATNMARCKFVLRIRKILSDNGHF